MPCHINIVCIFDLHSWIHLNQMNSLSLTRHQADLRRIPATCLNNVMFKGSNLRRLILPSIKLTISSVPAEKYINNSLQLKKKCVFTMRCPSSVSPPQLCCPLQRDARACQREVQETLPACPASCHPRPHPLTHHQSPTERRDLPGQRVKETVISDDKCVTAPTAIVVYVRHVNLNNSSWGKNCSELLKW